MEAVSFPRAAFHTLTGLYEFVELDAQRNRAECQRYDVHAFPGFAVLDSAGKVLVPPDMTMFRMMFTEPTQIAGTMTEKFAKLYADANAVPPSADVVRAVLEYERARGQKEPFEALLTRALKNPNAAADQIAGLQVYRALVLRRAGQKDEGLALLKETVPPLTFAEASDEAAAKLEHGLAPFTVGKGAVTFGTVSSDVDAALAANAFAWLAKLDGDIPSPKGLNSQILATGGASLAAVLNRPKDADPWLVYCRIRASQAYDNSARMAFCDGLVRLAEGKTKAGVERLTTVLKNAPGMSFAPAAGVIASEALAKAGNAVGAKEIADLVAQTYGDHLAPELQARLTK